MLKCRYCGKELPLRYVVSWESTYCDNECADAQWREQDADTYAYYMSKGRFATYEDYMRDKGATIVGDYDMPQRES